jgi:hypothetical protein
VDNGLSLPLLNILTPNGDIDNQRRDTAFDRPHATEYARNLGIEKENNIFVAENIVP